MATQFNPNDPYRANLSDDEIARQARLNSLDNELPPDPELAEGSGRGTKIAMFAIAIALVLGAVFYGLNNSSVNHAGTSSTAQNTAPSAPSSPPAAPPGMRDVTPHSNSDQGMTTGAAPARPQAPPTAAPSGQDMNRSGNSSANNPGK